MFQALATALAAGLSIWDSKEKRKYIDRLAELRIAYHEEFNKDLSTRSDAVLDRLEFELRVLAYSFAASSGKPDA